MPYHLSGVHLAIEGRDILRPLTLDLPGGRVVGLIGQNGSGKSSLVKLLARQMTPTSGDLLYEGQPVGAYAARDFARRVAYLPQTPPAVGGLLVREFVAFGRYPWHGALGRFSAEDAREVEEAMRLTDVAPFADRLVETLSGGERQRVWLAMLIAQNSHVLLLDEPISALDIAHQIEVMSLVRDLSRKRELGAIVVLHDVNIAARFCDHIVALKGGALVMSGPPAELMHSERLEAIYGIPMGVLPHPAGGAPMSFVH
jgi:ferric hydroxamate transport system ATP-binding protein